MKVRFYNIVWDTDGEDVGLPAELTLTVDNDETVETLNEFGADRLSEEKGWCVESFEWQTLPDSGPALNSGDGGGLDATIDKLLQVHGLRPLLEAVAGGVERAQVVRLYPDDEEGIEDEDRTTAAENIRADLF